ncbi:thermonuclease family protein [Nesterenkonia flava]|uniref:Thermonuclease family protein n=1 Tax=Nesterenkonia flava TaxID=469799 RepID=A0ABU1FW47_9MICC|nr:thermonuclease family protein [Nesterenkonia flava]MDR5712909.1 thermonuclease family protein [Nesterenkonia flava]
MTAVVTRVIDGDTLELADGERVRLLGIDSPERGECHFDTASARMSELVLGQSVTLTRAGEDRDRYDRLLRYVDVDGTDAGLTLIQEGLAISRYDSRDGYGYHPRQPDYVDADALTPLRTCPVEAPPVSSEAAPQAPVGENCDPNYMPCVPVYPPDINCSDITFPVRVIGSDVHRLDADGDGVGCEGNG